MLELALDGGVISPMVQSLICIGARVAKVQALEDRYVVVSKGRKGKKFYFNGNKPGFLTCWRRSIEEAKGFSTKKEAEKKANSFICGNATVLYMSRTAVTEEINAIFNEI